MLLNSGGHLVAHACHEAPPFMDSLLRKFATQTKPGRKSKARGRSQKKEDPEAYKGPFLTSTARDGSQIGLSPLKLEGGEITNPCMVSFETEA